MPRGRGNIDHPTVGPSGVKVIDAKRYRGRIDVQRRWLAARADGASDVGGRERTKLVDGVTAQAEAVRKVLAAGPHATAPVQADGVTAQAEAVRKVLAAGPHATAPVQAVLCFVDGDWPLLGRLEIRGVPVLPLRRVSKLCAADGPLDAETTVSQIAETLAIQFPPA